MIYRKNIEPKCRLCKNGEILSGNNIKCKLKGIVPGDYACKKFDYDIFKREIKPKPKLKTEKFSKSDFEI